MCRIEDLDKLFKTVQIKQLLRSYPSLFTKLRTEIQQQLEENEKLETSTGKTETKLRSRKIPLKILPKPPPKIAFSPWGRK